MFKYFIKDYFFYPFLFLLSTSLYKLAKDIYSLSLFMMTIPTCLKYPHRTNTAVMVQMWDELHSIEFCRNYHHADYGESFYILFNLPTCLYKNLLYFFSNFFTNWGHFFFLLGCATWRTCWLCRYPFFRE